MITRTLKRLVAALLCAYLAMGGAMDGCARAQGAQGTLNLIVLIDCGDARAAADPDELTLDAARALVGLARTSLMRVAVLGYDVYNQVAHEKNADHYPYSDSLTREMIGEGALLDLSGLSGRAQAAAEIAALSASLLRAGVRDADPGYAVRQAQAIVESHRAQAMQGERYAIVLISAGEVDFERTIKATGGAYTASERHRAQYNAQELETSARFADEAVEFCRGASIPIYCLQLGSDAYREDLDRLSASTGGRYLVAPDASDALGRLLDAYAEISGIAAQDLPADGGAVDFTTDATVFETTLILCAPPGEQLTPSRISLSREGGAPLALLAGTQDGLVTTGAGKYLVVKMIQPGAAAWTLAGPEGMEVLRADAYDVEVAIALHAQPESVLRGEYRVDASVTRLGEPLDAGEYAPSLRFLLRRAGEEQATVFSGAQPDGAGGLYGQVTFPEVGDYALVAEFDYEGTSYASAALTVTVEPGRIVASDLLPSSIELSGIPYPRFLAAWGLPLSLTYRIEDLSRLLVDQDRERVSFASAARSSAALEVFADGAAPAGDAPPAGLSSRLEGDALRLFGLWQEEALLTITATSPDDVLTVSIPYTVAWNLALTAAVYLLALSLVAALTYRIARALYALRHKPFLANSALKIVLEEQGEIRLWVLMGSGRRGWWAARRTRRCDRHAPALAELLPGLGSLRVRSLGLDRSPSGLERLRVRYVDDAGKARRVTLARYAAQGEELRLEGGIVRVRYIA